MLNQSVCLFLFFCVSHVFAALRQAPRYDELLTMSALSQLREKNITNRLAQSLYFDSNGRNYLDSISKSVDDYDNTNQIARAQRYSAADVCTPLSIFNISNECCQHTKLLMVAVAQKKMWALQMIDSFGKLPSGVLLGDFIFPGSIDECKSADVLIEANLTGVPLNYQPFTPKYCQVIFPIDALSNKQRLQFGPINVGITTGICTPNTCKPRDIEILVESGIHLMPFHIGENITTIVNCEEEQKYDDKAIISLVICSIFVFILVLGTLYDIIITQIPKSKPKDEDSSPTENDSLLPQTTKEDISSKTDTEPGIVGKILLCFSVYKNASKLLKTEQPKGSLTCIHGIRFLSLTWVILGHTYVFGLPVFRNPVNALIFMKRFTFQAIINATVSVDTFFVLSGLLVAYGCLSSMKSKAGKVNWLYFYCHRFWRLTPPYMLVMMVYIPLFQYWGDGPYWLHNGIERNYCKDTWYYNLLYINNFVSNAPPGMCMAWSWYLSNDMQFYVISPLLLVLFYKSSKAGLAAIFVLLLAQFTAAGVISTKESFSVIMQTNKYFEDLYIKPYNRIGPYLVGMVYGYYLYKNNCKMTLNRYVCALLWLMATVSAVSVVYGLYNYNNGYVLSQNTASFYNAVRSSVWAFSVGWVIYACCTGYGGFVNTILSWKAFIPLSRLTYCAYLVHPIVMYYFYFNLRYSIYLTNIIVVFLFLGFIVTSYMVAFIASMAFEAPMLGLEAVLLRNNKK